MFVLDEREADQRVAVRAEPIPGETATLASRASFSAKASDPSAWNRSGIGAQTNIVPFGFANHQPARASPSQSASRRDW